MAFACENLRLNYRIACIIRNKTLYLQYEACEASEKEFNGSDKYPSSRTAGRKFESFV